MQLISFDSPIKCSCKKRPSVHIKSPYVADIITSNEDDALAHCPSLGLGGLITGGSQMLATHSNKGSKTDYVIQAVKDGEVWVGNVPLHANRIVKKLLGTDLLLQGVKHVIPEFKHGDSRLDFFITMQDDTDVFCEVKSVHINDGTTAVFPVGYKKPGQSTVSERANKHVTELTSVANEGFAALLVFVILRGDCNAFQPNWKQDAMFSNLLKTAQSAGVIVKIVYTDVNEAGIFLKNVETLGRLVAPLK